MINKKVINKKGISPLIATVLIIGFTIVIAFLVITWLTGRTDALMCQEACEMEGAQICGNSVGDLSFEADDEMKGLSITNGGTQDFTTTVTCYHAGAADNTGSSLIEKFSSWTFVCAVTNADLFKVIPSVRPAVEDEDCICESVTCQTIEVTE